MSIQDATFVVQRGADQFSCLGSELGAKALDSDLLLAQRGDTHGSIVKANIQDADLFVVTDGDNGHKSVTGAQVKSLFTPPEPELNSLVVGAIINITSGQWDSYSWSWWNGASGYNTSATGIAVYVTQNGMPHVQSKDKFATLKVLEVKEMTNGTSPTLRMMPSKLEVVASPYGGFDASTNDFGIVRDGVIDGWSNTCTCATSYPLYKP